MHTAVGGKLLKMGDIDFLSQDYLAMLPWVWEFPRVWVGDEYEDCTGYSQSSLAHGDSMGILSRCKFKMATL